jgi:membrane-associated PAP2 superfamily phosphatase
MRADPSTRIAMSSVFPHAFSSAAAAQRRRGAHCDATQLKPGGGPRLVWTHVILPLIGVIVLLALTSGFGGDQWLADRLYALQGGRWALRQAFVTQQLVHQAGRDIGIAVWLSLLVAWMVARRRRAWVHLRAPLAYLLVATAMSMLCVAWMKSWSNMDCPWDLLRYGGERPYVGLWTVRPIGLARGSCFPAGHASGGYAWLALYFFFGAVRPRWRWLGLATGLAVGLAFGISQQLRGAHFASHDVCTAAICWAVSLGTWGAFRARLVQSRWLAAGFGTTASGGTTGASA